MYEVKIDPTGEVIEVEEGQTILAAALRQGDGCRLLAATAPAQPVNASCWMDM